MTDLDQAKQRLHSDLGYKPLRKSWAKAEILIGLLAMGISLVVITIAGGQGRVDLELAWLPGSGVCLFLLGGYLTLAGQRSHLYQTMNDHTAYLLLQIKDLQNKGDKLP